MKKNASPENQPEKKKSSKEESASKMRELSTQSDAAPMDFSPFDPLMNLEAVSEVIKTIRHLSWSYAGDIARTVIKIGRTFHAGRFVVCVCTDKGRIEVYEYTDGTVPSLQDYFDSSDGQKFLMQCLELAPDCVQVGSSELSAFPDQLGEPASYVFPLRHQYAKRHVVKPGLLLMQEPVGLARWNKRFLDSVIVVAEYLAMVIECERLYAIVHEVKPLQSEP
jgi:hypothetical protein